MLTLQGYGGWLHQDIYSQCTNRFEFRSRVSQRFKDCRDLMQSAPVCGGNVTVAYSNHPPYVFKKVDGSVAGILPG